MLLPPTGLATFAVCVLSRSAMSMATATTTTTDTAVNPPSFRRPMDTRRHRMRPPLTIYVSVDAFQTLIRLPSAAASADSMPPGASAGTVMIPSSSSSSSSVGAAYKRAIQQRPRIATEEEGKDEETNVHDSLERRLHEVADSVIDRCFRNAFSRIAAAPAESFCASCPVFEAAATQLIRAGGGQALPTRRCRRP